MFGLPKKLIVADGKNEFMAKAKVKSGGGWPAIR